MKTIGMIGGVTWQSTILYYTFINEEINRRLGGKSIGKILIKSVNFEELLDIQNNRGWDELGEYLAGEAKNLEKGGADFLLIGANTLHKIADIISKDLQIPLVHIVDNIAETVKDLGYSNCGLLGTRFTMEEDFFSGKLSQEYDINTMIPEPEDRAFLHHIIYEELSKGIVKEETRQRMIKVIAGFKDKGAETVILGCTELGLVINEENSPIHPVDTVKVHAMKAVDLALEE